MLVLGESERGARFHYRIKEIVGIELRPKTFALACANVITMTSKRPRRNESGSQEGEKEAENETRGGVFDLRFPGALRVGLTRRSTQNRP